MARDREVLEGTELAGVEINMQVNDPTTRTEFNLRMKELIHRTGYGACKHDWSMRPCTIHVCIR